MTKKLKGKIFKLTNQRARIGQSTESDSNYLFSTSSLKFLFKNSSEWCEIFDENKILPVNQQLIEAKVEYS